MTKTEFHLTISIQYQYNINTISIQYQYNINQTGDENKEKYKFEDFLVDPISISQK